MKFSSKVYHELTWIYWRHEGTLVKLSQRDFQAKYNELKAKRTIIKYTCKRDVYSDESVVAIRNISDYTMLYLKENRKYMIYTTNNFDDEKNLEDNHKGSRAIQSFSDAFKLRNNTSMLKAFGTAGEQFKRCVPKQFMYKNDSYLHKHLIASSLDGCSQYPSNMCGRLPDSNTMIEIKGRIEPNAEYPFAFYKSGHVAEYQVFDTHTWEFNPYFYCLFRFNEWINKDGVKKYNWPIQPCKDEEEVTYLMKASKYTLDDIWQEFYDKRKVDNDAKIVMNSAIGMMHTEKYTSYKYVHLVAIAIARGNQKILDMCQRIGYDNIIHICVDGIIYLGSKEYGVNYKQLGVFNQEFTGCDFMISNVNKYIAMKNNKCVKAKHGNCNENILPDEQITNLTEQYNWIHVNPLEGVKNGKTI